MDFILAMNDVGGRAMCSFFAAEIIRQEGVTSRARLKLPEIGSGACLRSVLHGCLNRKKHYTHSSCTLGTRHEERLPSANPRLRGNVTYHICIPFRGRIVNSTLTHNTRSRGRTPPPPRPAPCPRR
jgi:hypothetical protein